MMSWMYLIADGQEYIIKNRGRLNFFNTKKSLDFEINLSSYYENAIEIRNYTERLNYLCTIINKPSQCELFLHMYNRDLHLIENNVNYIKGTKKRRNKRWAGFAWKLAKFAGKFIMADLAVSAVTWSVTEAIEKNKNLKVFNASTMQDIPKIYKKIAEYENNTEMANEQIRTAAQDYGETRDFLSEMKFNHNAMTIKLMHVLHGDVRTQFFDLFDYKNFTEKINVLNKELLPNRTLPVFERVEELFELSTIITSKNDSHIRISLEIPIISTEMYTLFEFVPVPFIKNNFTQIIISNSMFYYMEAPNQAMVIPKIKLDECSNFENLTLCSTGIKQDMEIPDICMDLVIFKQDAKMCQVRKLIPKNYYMQTSDFSIFCYIINQTKVRVSCNEKNIVYTMIKSDEITYEDECDMLEIANEIIMDKTSESIMEVSTPLVRPNVSVYDSIYKKWTSNMISLNRHQLLMEIENDTIALAEEFHEYEKTGKNSNFENFAFRGLKFISAPFSMLVNFFSKLNTISQILVYIFASPIIICMLYSLFVRKREK